MYNIRQFKPTMYFLVLLGIAGFCIAAEMPGLWLLATGAILINGWLVKTGRFVPMARWLANTVTLGCLAVIIFEIRGDEDSKIIVVGQGLVLLQIIKCYEQRGNRDYAQLLILSFLLIIAASISTASLLFGICFVLYLFVSLYCYLLFHLKVETDRVSEEKLQGAAAGIDPAIQQQHEHLPKSMRRVTASIAVFAVATSAVVFLLFPRDAGEDVLSGMQMRGPVLTGFTDNVSFQKVAQISRNDDVAARLELYDGGKKVTEPGHVLLRGTTLDYYTGSDDSQGAPWSWRRKSVSISEEKEHSVVPSEPWDLTQDPNVGHLDDVPYRYEQRITLQPTGTNVLFALPGVHMLSTQSDQTFLYWPRDGTIGSWRAIRAPLEYTAWSTGEIPNPTSDPVVPPDLRIDPAIQKFALQPDVCGVDAQGTALATYPLAGDHSHDLEIAGRIEGYLRSHFRYTLDLTDIAKIGDRDPIAAFLTDFHEGHCEYFAGAMTLLCQTLHIPARMVVGFSCDTDDFNSLGNYYIVRQSNAHAWCEVYADKQWRTFDPTAGASGEAIASHGFSNKVKDFLDLLEFKWATSVVGYAGADRRNMMENLDASMTRAAENGSQGFFQWPKFLSDRFAMINDWWNGVQWSVSSAILGVAIVLVFIALAAAIAWFFLERWIMRRRARRIGLETLSASDQLRLARQLAFYDELIRILSRHRIHRPVHLTPLEFSRSLSHLPGSVYDDVYRLTELFYRIRYGDAPLGVSRHKWLSTIVHRIQKTMDTVHPAAAK